MDGYDEPTALARIAEQAGFSLSDAAFVSGLDESTISRLWNDPKWLDRVKGASLQKLIAAVPGVAGYVTGHSLASRRTRLARDLAHEGLNVSQAALDACRLDGVPEPYVGNALEAAVHTMRGDVPKVTAYLARFWGRDQDRALERLYSTHEGTRLLDDPQPLLTASAELAPRLSRKAYSFHSILAQSALAHHVGRATGHTGPGLAAGEDRQEAFTLRSSVMGALIEGDDVGLAEEYERLVAGSPLLTMIEEWSLPTYSRDTRPNPDFALPGSILLRNTASEVIWETGSYSDAYVHYLLSTYLPLALQRDPTFGLSLRGMASAVARRLDAASEPRLRKLCENVLRDLHGALND